MLIIFCVCPDGPEKAALTGAEELEVKDKISLKCNVESMPVPTYVWKLNGTVISGATSSELSIEHATYKNSGMYTCEARNAVTGKSSMANHSLSIKGQTQVQNPLFLLTSPDVRSHFQLCTSTGSVPVCSISG